MSRVIFFVDGFNLYHALDENISHHKYKWLDLSSLCRKFVRSRDTIEDIYYFTALAIWNPDKEQRHKIYIRALLTRNIRVIYGAFRLRDKRCRLCHKTFKTYEEKETDINIIAHLFSLAIQDRYDTAMIITGDSDLVQGIQMVQSTFPAKQVGIIIPSGRRAEVLKQAADFHMKIKEGHLKNSLFEKEIDLGKNQKLICPKSWI